MKNQNCRNSLKKSADAVMQMDRFGEEPKFTVNGYSKYPGIFSALISFVIFVIVLIYGSAKYSIMNEYGDTNF